jgi:acetyl-CoA carboxylase, biotin carboxylase subunit
MIGKVISHGENRSNAIAKMRNALVEIIVDGIKTNIELHQDILSDPVFQKGSQNIHYLEKKLAASKDGSSE